MFQLLPFAVVVAHLALHQTSIIEPFCGIIKGNFGNVLNLVRMELRNYVILHVLPWKTVSEVFHKCTFRKTSQSFMLLHKNLTICDYDRGGGKSQTVVNLIPKIVDKSPDKIRWRAHWRHTHTYAGTLTPHTHVLTCLLPLQGIQFLPTYLLPLRESSICLLPQQAHIFVLSLCFNFSFKFVVVIAVVIFSCKSSKLGFWKHLPPKAITKKVTDIPFYKTFLKVNVKLFVFIFTESTHFAIPRHCLSSPSKRKFATSCITLLSFPRGIYSLFMEKIKVDADKATLLGFPHLERAKIILHMKSSEC